MGSTLLPPIFCSSLFSLTRADPVFILAFRSFLISFLSLNSLLSSLQIRRASCLAASPSYPVVQGKIVRAVQQVLWGKAEWIYVQQRLLDFLVFSF